MLTLPWLQIASALYLLWVVTACASILMGRRSPAATLAWMFAFAALPVVSGIVYLLFGPRRMLRKRRRYDLARARVGTPEHVQRAAVTSCPVIGDDASGLAAVARRLGQGEPTFASSVLVLDDGDSTFAALEQAIAAARHHVHVEYYIWEPDQAGTRVRDALTAAALRGLQVRALYDHMGSSNAGRSFWAPLRAAGAEVRAFNPLGFSLASVNFANFRTHRKIVVCDGRVGFLGGINLHDPELVSVSGARTWRDTHVRIDGEPVWRLQQLFLENWTYSGGSVDDSTETVAALFPASTCGDVGQAVQILGSGPDDERAAIHAFTLAAISTARERVWIETPYLIPDEPLESAMRIADLRGVDVQVIVPRTGDSLLVTAASRTYCEALRRVGVRIHEYGPPMLHAKTMVVDRTVAVVGTANMDNRSFRLNFEVAAAFYDPAVIGQLARAFEADRAMCRPFASKRRGVRRQTFLESLARLTSPVL